MAAVFGSRNKQFVRQIPWVSTILVRARQTNPDTYRWGGGTCKPGTHTRTYIYIYYTHIYIYIESVFYVQNIQNVEINSVHHCCSIACRYDCLVRSLHDFAQNVEQLAGIMLLDITITHQRISGQQGELEFRPETESLKDRWKVWKCSESIEVDAKDNESIARHWWRDTFYNGHYICFELRKKTGVQFCWLFDFVSDPSFLTFLDSLLERILDTVRDLTGTCEDSSQWGSHAGDGQCDCSVWV